MRGGREEPREDGRLRGVSQAPEAPVDGGVLAQAPVPLAVGFDVGADLAVRVEEGEAAEPEARVLALSVATRSAAVTASRRLGRRWYF